MDAKEGIRLWSMIPLLLLVVSYPFGVAVHGVMSTISVILALAMVKKTSYSFKPITSPIIISSLYVVWVTISGVISGTIESNALISDFVGYIGWIAIPPALTPLLIDISHKQRQQLVITVQSICVLWGLVVLSQHLLGWRVSGHSIIPDGFRPRGFYSHPLTLAYCALIPFPMLVNVAFERPQKLISWLSLMSLGSIIFFTLSRTVQAVAFLVIIWSVFNHLKGRQKIASLLTIFALISALFVIPNPVANKFVDTFSEKGVDKHGEYADDRLVFWHAHWEMIKERPLTGHGNTRGSQYRNQYYQKIGMPQFKKKYEAHNMFIQIIANSGLIGLCLFLSWLGWHFLNIQRIEQKFYRSVYTQTLTIFCLAGLTQNAFQDSEVRMGLTLLTLFIWVSICQTQKKNLTLT